MNERPSGTPQPEVDNPLRLEETLEERVRRMLDEANAKLDDPGLGSSGDPADAMVRGARAAEKIMLMVRVDVLKDVLGIREPGQGGNADG